MVYKNKLYHICIINMRLIVDNCEYHVKCSYLSLITRLSLNLLIYIYLAVGGEEVVVVTLSTRTQNRVRNGGVLSKSSE